MGTELLVPMDSPPHASCGESMGTELLVPMDSPPHASCGESMGTELLVPMDSPPHASCGESMGTELLVPMDSPPHASCGESMGTELLVPMDSPPHASCGESMGTSSSVPMCFIASSGMRRTGEPSGSKTTGSPGRYPPALSTSRSRRQEPRRRPGESSQLQLASNSRRNRRQKQTCIRRAALALDWCRLVAPPQR
ncbi:hypothetical protein NHX12_023521 [Muraenolepis orangiensis]|uniref:Uncharacterized protein n=1 Tax=Muraenolepis orangiensis TaxID=630683 RepID=A0A9Q0EM87_9TELE|nr:hypothetical protein NHX12_023521 [Muraenolepis orangiensis]